MKLKALLFSAAVAVLVISSSAIAQYTREDIWKNEIGAFKDIDRKQNPPEKPILFVGSSSIRFWVTLREDFPDLKVMNRGFGGSRIDDLVHYAPDIVEPYRPKQIVVYSGENDIEAKRTPEDVLADLKRFIEFRDTKLPGTPIAYISLKPSILRWNLWPQMARTNELLKSECGRHKRVQFIDVATKMLIADGTPDELKRKVGGERLRIKLVAAGDTERAAQALGQVGIGSATVDDDGVTVTVALAPGIDAVAEAAAALAQLGVTVADFGVFRPSLDDVFLSLTGAAA